MACKQPDIGRRTNDVAMVSYFARPTDSVSSRDGTACAPILPRAAQVQDAFGRSVDDTHPT